MKDGKQKKFFAKELDFIASYLAEFFKDEPKKAVIWMMTPNPHLGQIVPAWLMLSHPNGAKKLMQFVRDCKEGNIP